MRASAHAAVEAGLSLAQRWQIARAQSLRILARKPWDESEHPREPAGSSEGGQFTSDGGGGAEPAKEPPAAAHDPKVVEVGGDEWNRATAKRLEQEYQEAKPQLDVLTDQATGKTTEIVTSDEDEEPPFTPEEWESLSGSGQSDAEEKFIEQNKESYYQSEVDYWYSSGNALDDAKVMVASDFDGDDWAAEAIADYRTEREDDGEKPIPYTDEQLLEAISLDYEGGYEGKGDLDLTFDDAKLQEPSNLPPPEQGTLPGIEPPDASAQLTQEMRDGLTKAIEDAFDKEAQTKSESLEPPDYLAESVDEYIKQAWAEKSDGEKFEWVKSNTEIVESETTEGSGGPVADYETVDALPDEFDPLNMTSGTDYSRTQRLARYLSLARAKQLLQEREIATPTNASLARADSQLWSDWKGSSTSENGRLLQIAAADELGGRLNAKTSRDLDRHAMVEYANSEFSTIGGYAGVKAYVRAKWETTQYLLDRAGIKELELFRAIRLDRELYQKLFKHLAEAVAVGDHKHMPSLHVARNGAASTTVNASVANGWGMDETRVVLRALVPRTAALSIPAYGINVHSEREVVVAGTAWKGWDAWAGKAPSFDDVPLKLAA